jgi:LmbE family N-acetylglucosaminyl deacetylase
MPLVLSQPSADQFVPDGSDVESALRRTTHLAIGAHADDLELMAAHGILECFQQKERWFTGVVVTDGAGSAREHAYAGYSDEELRATRRLEQRKAAYVGEYSAVLQLGHPSRHVKEPAQREVASDLEQVLARCQPEVVYTHNLADKHDTHVAVALRVVAAYRSVPETSRPRRLIGCEVWRDLDWLCDADKLAMPVDERDNLNAALMGVFDSQITSGKRYDLAAAGRRRAHATFSEAHDVDEHRGLIWGMDLTPLLSGADPERLVRDYVDRFEREVRDRITRLR